MKYGGFGFAVCHVGVIGGKLKVNFQKQGGEKLNKNEKALNTLKSIVGREVYEKLCDEMPGVNIRIPGLRGGFTSYKERNKAIREDMWNNVPMRDIAKKYGLSISHIYKIVENRE